MCGHNIQTTIIGKGLVRLGIDGINMVCLLMIRDVSELMIGSQPSIVKPQILALAKLPQLPSKRRFYQLQTPTLYALRKERNSRSNILAVVHKRSTTKSISSKHYPLSIRQQSSSIMQVSGQPGHDLLSFLNASPTRETLFAHHSQYTETEIIQHSMRSDRSSSA